MENNEENVYYVDEDGHKVVETKEAPSWLAKKAVLFYVIGGAIVFTLVGATFGSKIMALINKVGGKNLDNIPTPTNTPYISQKAEVEKLPEDISTANQEEIENTPAVDSEVLEADKEVKIEEAALAYYNRLSAIPGYPNNYEKVLDMTKRLNHRFNLEGIGTQTELENYAMSISLFLMDFTNTIIYNDGVDGSKNLSMDVDSEKIFPNANENEKALLKVVEDLGSKVYTSRRTDREAFEKNSRLFLSLMAKIYFSETSSEVNWEGTMIPDFESMDMFVDEVIRYYGIGYLTIIANDPQGKNFTAIDNECFTAAILIQRLLGGITCDTISIIAENSSQEIIDDVKIAKERTLGLAPTSKP